MLGGLSIISDQQVLVHFTHAIGGSKTLKTYLRAVDTIGFGYVEAGKLTFVPWHNVRFIMEL